MNIFNVRRLGGIVAFSFVLLVAGSNESIANVIYDLSAICDDRCNGAATGVLTLEDSYIPGSSVAIDDFISLAYSSSSGTLDLGPPAGFGVVFRATMPVVSGVADFLILSTLASYRFETQSSGDWAVQTFDLLGGDGGSSHTWTLRAGDVSEPPSGLMLVFGTMIIGWHLRHRNCQ